MKALAFSVMILTSPSAFASLVHLQGDTFLDGNISIQYPCGHGGEPLVIYSMPVNNVTPISSLVPIYPSYVKNGYSAENLTIDSGLQNTHTSKRDLIVTDFNPGVNAVHFGLSRSDQTSFYLNTINFAVIDATATSHFVSSFSVNVNGALYAETVTPQMMPNFIEDKGISVMSLVKSVEGTEYSWDQSKAWRSYANMTRYPVPYDFTPQEIGGNPGQYAGYGFWVCGQDNARSTTVLSSAKPGQVYEDHI
ncbi:MAG: hypothetical protein NTV32_04485 [Gammaproteobacteria bacterium]|nr:hypothetical protein [Gammaproteobacteria bacterium]